MRIIGGTARGRRLQTPSKSTAKFPGQIIRPTADRAREALFSIIGREVEDALVLDLFAGTGALGLEALSRSAREAVFIDSNPHAVQLIKNNIQLCGFSDRTLVLKRNLSNGLNFFAKQLPGIRFSIIFMDPPYRKGISSAMLQEVGKAGILTRGGLVVVEDEMNSELPAEIAGLELVDKRHYGETGFWLYRHTGTENQII